MKTDEQAILANAKVSLKPQFAAWTMLLSKIVDNNNYNCYKYITNNKDL